MKKLILSIAIIAVASFVACGDKPTPPAAEQPAAVQTPPPAPVPEPAPAQPVAQQPAAEQPAAKPVEQKIDIKAEPGRSVVITDLHVGAAKQPVDVGELKFRDPGAQFKFQPDANVKLRPATGAVPPTAGATAPAGTGSN